MGLQDDEDAVQKLTDIQENARARRGFMPLRIFLEDGEGLESLREHDHLWIEVLGATEIKGHVSHVAASGLSTEASLRKKGL